eukprot:scaffold9597_cov20-Tisochrysis_lutea.AAC.1
MSPGVCTHSNTVIARQPRAYSLAQHESDAIVLPINPLSGKREPCVGEIHVVWTVAFRDSP